MDRASSLQSKRRIRVVISINSAWNIVNFRSGLIRALLDEGLDVAAVAPLGEFSAELEALGCEFVALAMDAKGTNPWVDLMLFCRYLRRLRRLRPDVYLGFTIKPNIYGSLAAHCLSIPVINNVSGLGTAFIRDTWLTRVTKRLYRMAFRRSHTVFFQNNDDRRLFIDEKLVAPQQTALLPGSGVDLERFAPAVDGVRGADGGTRFLLIARLLYDKGVGEYVAAARAIKAERAGCTFGLLGFLDAENRTAVPRQMVEQWVREGIVEYLGTTNDVRPHIASADCVVLPSYREGLPRALLEAAAMAKPVIATDVPGCREVVEDGRTGLLCKVKDARDLARAMSAFCDLSPDERQAMGRAGRAKVEREFDERIVISRYLDRLRSVITIPPAARLDSEEGALR